MEPTVACSEQAPAGRTAQPAALPAPRNPIGFPHPRSPSPRCLRPTPHGRFFGTRHDFGVKLPLEISHLPETSPGPPGGAGRGQG